MCFLLLQNNPSESRRFYIADGVQKVYIDTYQSAEIADEAAFQKYLQEYLAKYTPHQLEIASEANDCRLKLIIDETLDIQQDGFQIEVSDVIKISVKNIPGLLYAVQGIMSTISQQGFISYGKYVDYPKQKERALMVDVGRKYFTKQWVFKLIEYMHNLRLNTLQLHFSDNEGFRIASDLYPEVTSQRHLTKQEIKEIIDYASFYQIEVIPDFDTPGHLKQVLSKYSNYQLSKIEDGQLVKNIYALNIADKEAREFVKSLLKEFAELFSQSKYFHIGADEFIDIDRIEKYPDLVAYAKERYGEEATGLETFIEYTNEIIEYVISLGFTPRIWNDGFYRKNRKSMIPLDKRAQITYWTRSDKNMAEVADFIERGHEIINFNDDYFYYVVGETPSYPYPSAEKITEQWQVEKFSNEQVLNAEEMKSVLGTSFAIWCDHPDAQEEDDVFNDAKGPLKEMAKKLWVTSG